MELNKFEDVIGLRFQYYNKINLNESESDHDGPSEVEDLELEEGQSQVVANEAKLRDNLVFKLEFDDSVVSLSYPHNKNLGENSPPKAPKTSENDLKNNSKEELEDFLLIETEANIYVYNIKSYKYTYIHTKNGLKPSLGFSEAKKTFYNLIKNDFLVINGNSVELIGLSCGNKVKRAKIGVSEEVKYLSNVYSNKVFIITSNNSIYLLKNEGFDTFSENGLKLGKAKMDKVSNLYNNIENVVSCYIFEEDKVVLSLILDNEDFIVLICKVVAFGGLVNGTSKSFDFNSLNSSVLNGLKDENEFDLEVLGHCYNELYLSLDEFTFEPSNEPKLPKEKLSVSYKYLEKWNLLIIYSNKSTSTLLITSNEKLIKLNESLGDSEGEGSFRILLLQEGYNLESIEFDDFIVNLEVFYNYKNEIYRKNSLQDTPTLKDPPLFLIHQKSGTISMFYGDNYHLDNKNCESLILDKLSDPKEMEKCKENQFKLIDKMKEFYVPKTLKDPKDAKSSLDPFLNFTNKPSRIGSKEVKEPPKKGESELIDSYYNKGYKNYSKDPISFKLFETLTNVLYYFNESLENLEKSSPQSSKEGFDAFLGFEELENDGNKNINLYEYVIITNKLLDIQNNIIKAHLSETSPRIDLNTELDPNKLNSNQNNDQTINNLTKKLNEVINIQHNIKISKDFQEELKEDLQNVENVFIYTYNRLVKMNTKLINLNNKLNKFIINKHFNKLFKKSLNYEINGENGQNQGILPKTKVDRELTLLYTKLCNCIKNVKSLYEKPQMSLTQFTPKSYTQNILKYNNYNKILNQDLSPKIESNFEEGLIKSFGSFTSTNKSEGIFGGGSGLFSVINKPQPTPPKPLDFKDETLPQIDKSPFSFGSGSIFGERSVKDVSEEVAKESKAETVLPDTSLTTPKVPSNITTKTPTTTTLTTNLGEIRENVFENAFKKEEIKFGALTTTLNTNLVGANQSMGQSESVFSKFNTNKSLIDIASNLNTNSGGFGKGFFNQSTQNSQSSGFGTGFTQNSVFTGQFHAQSPFQQPSTFNSGLTQSPFGGFNQSSIQSNQQTSIGSSSGGGGENIWTSSRRSNPLD